MSDWTKETPTPGEWWLSVEPKKRLSAFPAVIRCEVREIGCASIPPRFPHLGLSALYAGAGRWTPLSDEFFVGAQWKRVEADPTDPFEPKPVNWGDIACRADVSPETIAWAAAYDKKMAEINKKLGR